MYRFFPQESSSQSAVISNSYPGTIDVHQAFSAINIFQFHLIPSEHTSLALEKKYEETFLPLKSYSNITKVCMSF